MANPDPSSIASKIMTTRIYLSGETFTPRDIYSAIHMPANRVTAALATLSDRGDVEKVADGVYRKPQQHWIHKMRLANKAADVE